MKLVECVPNFSEGRDKAKVQKVVDAAKSAGVTILDVETDADHHRCVLSFVGAPDACVEACFRVAKTAMELIDLNTHKGEHPRMGAVDVIPFIPVAGVTIEDCVKLAEKLAARVGGELKIPTYLYDHAARRPERKDLAAVRKGQFEGLKDLIGKDETRTPDFGPNAIHPTAGAVAVGARQQIVNFNLNLDTHDMVAGKDIAKRLRASGGGLPAVRGKEIDLAARKQVQISTVLTDYKKTSMAKVLGTAMTLADEHKARIKTTEIVGLLPRQALVDFAIETLQLENFNPEVQILENRLEAVGALGNELAVYGWLAVGFMSFLVLEQFLHWHHCHRAYGTHRPVGYLILAADGLHNLIGGLAVGSAFVLDLRLGVVTWLVAAAHEVPQELGDFGLLLHSGWSRGHALAYNVVSALTFPIGGVVAYGLSGAVDVTLLVPFAAGNFLYIAAADLIPQFTSQESMQDKLTHTASFVVGLGGLYVLALLTS